MHTSNALSFLFGGAVFVAMAAQVVSYCSNRRTPGQTLALAPTYGQIQTMGGLPNGRFQRDRRRPSGMPRRCQR